MMCSRADQFSSIFLQSPTRVVMHHTPAHMLSMATWLDLVRNSLAIHNNIVPDRSDH
jgi:hypothetical protein